MWLLRLNLRSVCKALGDILSPSRSFIPADLYIITDTFLSFEAAFDVIENVKTYVLYKIFERDIFYARYK